MRRSVLALCAVIAMAACGSAGSTSQPQPSPATVWHPAGRPTALGWDGITQRVAMLYKAPAGGNLLMLELAGSSWVQVSTLNTNSAQALVYDSDRKREVVVTASLTNVPSPTLEWDGKAWTTGPAIGVPITAYSEAAFSPDLHATVLLDNGTWLYDGAGWRKLATKHTPAARLVGYDAVHHAVLALSDSTYQTWKFDGTDWTALPLEGFTPEYRGGVGRQWPAHALDASGHWVLFSGDVTISDTWVWDGQYWTKAPQVGTLPPGRVNGLMTWDAKRQRMVMFGGFGTMGSCGSCDLGDTWTWDGKLWTSVAGTVPTPTVSPGSTPASSVRTSPSPAQPSVLGERSNLVGPDGDGGLIMLTSPSTSASMSNTWRWDGTHWRLLPTTVSPDANFGGALIFDRPHKKLTAFGDPSAFGLRPSGQEQTWTWNGTSWTWLHPAHKPPPMYRPSVAYDDALGAVVLFGAVYDPSASAPVLGEAQTWSWNGSDWVRLSPAASPPPHYGATMAFDQLLNRLLLVGGHTSTSDVTPSQTTWAFDGSTWTQLDTTGPVADELSAAYDPISARVLVLAFPGAVYARAAAGWSQLRLSPFPTGRFVGAWQDPRDGRVSILASGGNLVLWAWDGSSWSVTWPSELSQWRTYDSSSGYSVRYPPYWYFSEQFGTWSNYNTGGPLAMGPDGVYMQAMLTAGSCAPPTGILAQSRTSIDGVPATRYRWDSAAVERVSYLSVRATRAGTCFDINIMGSASAVDANAALFDQIVATVTFR